jgi:pimeloyl-ACP methyl ester carboxylesterase
VKDLLTCPTTGGRELAWAEFGAPDGLPVLFLHGTPGSRLGPEPLDDFYQRIGIRIVAPDRAGCGRSDPLPGRRVLDAAADLVGILDALELDTVHVVGGSGGGPHALALGAHAPERVRCVGVLVGAAPLTADEVRGQASVNQEMLALLGQPEALQEKVAAAAKVLLTDGLGALVAEAPESDKALWAERAEFMHRTVEAAVERGVGGWAEDYEALWARPWGFTPQDVTGPVLWAHGSADLNVPLTAAFRYAASLPDCRFITWPDVGHAPGPDLMSEFYAALFARSLEVTDA